jgi:amino acid transporter
MAAIHDTNEKAPSVKVGLERSPSCDHDVGQGTFVDVTAGSQALHRSLRGKEVQLFAIGGAIGTCKSNLTLSVALI